MKTEIKIENISKSFDTQQVLDHITMDFQRGYIHLLNGNNGCGKSTLLKIDWLRIQEFHQREICVKCGE